MVAGRVTGGTKLCDGGLQFSTQARRDSASQADENEAEVISKYGQFNKSSTLTLSEDIFERIS